MGDYLVMSLRLSVHTYVYVILSSPALCVSYELIPKSLIGYNVDLMLQSICMIIQNIIM